MAEWQMNEYSFGQKFNFGKIYKNISVYFDIMTILIRPPYYLFLLYLLKGSTYPADYFWSQSV